MWMIEMQYFSFNKVFINNYRDTLNSPLSLATWQFSWMGHGYMWSTPVSQKKIHVLPFLPHLSMGWNADVVNSWSRILRNTWGHPWVINLLSSVRQLTSGLLHERETDLHFAWAIKFWTFSLHSFANTITIM